ncbi:uncharacterized protein K489DRAFT_388047 [Dissoconium aciculare CBS 342.82]|uniref:tRNA (guanine(9)-N1)-methyltransferase n=1 Tax=Dissoconium aciculare CBS 342.82 TaxID=1314786 RepID=A0A6J3M9D1_9PEZI|nr:uncharacterized protein K489DRAFT_388047 [Dissoconium aciculare CBS 342.82]KAF1824656.1 hypothetical protein K489DRAFT_388047 [Dissoconium aciculare CBS 342.82]
MSQSKNDDSEQDLDQRPTKLQKVQDNQFDRNGGTSEPATSTTAQALPDTKNEDGTPMSKSQLKKLRKKAEWEAKRPQWKALQKEKRIARRERKKVAKQQEQHDDADDGSTSAQRKSRSNFKPKAVQLPITFILDCDFDALMNERERISLASQLTRCYSDNGKSRFRAHLAIASFGGHLRERFETVLTHYKAWKGVRTFDEDFVAVANQATDWMREGNGEGGVLRGAFADLDVERSAYVETRGKNLQALQDAGEIVYLSSEADEDLTELKPYSTYIIGGLVDKNREKGICHRRATERGMRTARLPIGEFMEMTSRKVLATNHVNEIMLKWLECRDWGVAFDLVIPKRKGGKLKGSEENRDDENGDQDEDDNDDEDDQDQDQEEPDDDREDGGVELKAKEETDDRIDGKVPTALPS